MTDGPITEAAKKAHWWFTAMLAGAVAILLAGMGVSAYFGKFARAEVVAKHSEDIAAIKAVLPGIDRKLDILVETAAQREWRDHHVIIPTPASTVDAGAAR
jgi:hypothetical protein